MAKPKKKTKKQKHQSELNKQYSRERDRISRRIKALKQAGYIFDIDPTPPTIAQLGHNVGKKDIKALQKITPQSLRLKSEGYVNFETGELQTPQTGIETERKIKANQGKRNLLQQQLNLAKEKGEIKPVSSKTVAQMKENQFLGNQLYKMWKRIDDPEDRKLFVEYLTDKEYRLLLRTIGDKTKGENFMQAAKAAREERERRREKNREKQRNRRKSKSRENLPENEGAESEEEDYGNAIYTDEERNDTGTSYESEGPKNIEDTDEEDEDEESESLYAGRPSEKHREPDEITRDRETKKNIDQKYHKWKEDFDRLKHRKNIETRDYADDKETIMAQIQGRIDQFDQYMQSVEYSNKHEHNAENMSYLKNALRGAIKSQGLDTVLRNLEGKAKQIDELFNVLLFQYKETEAIDNATNELVEIFTGRSLTQSESYYYSSYADSVSDEEADDMRIYDLDE